MPRINVPAADAIIDQEFPCLDKGFVRLVDYMGGDERIVQAARVSYGPSAKTVNDDKGLIDHLLRNEHTSPFEQVSLTFHCKMPIFVARQWVRHRTAKLNEISGRYSTLKDEFYVPAPENIGYQSKDNKQGRDTDSEFGYELKTRTIESMIGNQDQAYEEYSNYLEAGISRELARINLPLSLYTEWYWKIDLHNLFHFLGLRLDPHAQYEIRVYAEEMWQIAQAVAPLACSSWENHFYNGVRFSGREIEVLRLMIRDMAISPKKYDVRDRSVGQSAETFLDYSDILMGKERERFLLKLLEGRQT